MYSEKEFLDYIHNKLGVKILYQKNHVYLIRVKHYKICRALFNKHTINWCIAQSEGHWDEYVSKPGNKQYFIVDFNHICSNDSDCYNNSLIGFTISKENTNIYKNNIFAAHARNDDNLLRINSSTGKTKFEDILKKKHLYDFIINQKMKSDNGDCSMGVFYFLIGSIILAICSLLIKF